MSAHTPRHGSEPPDTMADRLLVLWLLAARGELPKHDIAAALESLARELRQR